jgi:hypothetical protein
VAGPHSFTRELLQYHIHDKPVAAAQQILAATLAQGTFAAGLWPVGNDTQPFISHLLYFSLFLTHPDSTQQHALLQQCALY